MNRVRSPFRTAEAFLIEDIVDPRETRARLCEFAKPGGPFARTRACQLGPRP